MNIRLVDSHAHLPFLSNKMSADLLEGIVKSAKEEGVEKIINIGTSPKEHLKVLDVSKAYSNIYCALGIYPHESLDKDIPSLLLQLDDALGKSNKIVAVGECGIDISNWQKQRSMIDQEELFLGQVNLSLKHKLPIVIHNRNGTESVLKVLINAGSKIPKGVIHCFDGNWEQAKVFLDLNFYISFSGFITYETKPYLMEVARNVPRDMYLVETDSPYILPKSIATETSETKKNEPKYVRIVALQVAKARGCELTQVAEETYQNTHRLFGLQ